MAGGLRARLLRWTAAWLVASAPLASAPAAARPAGESQRPCPDWGMYGRTLARSFEACRSPIEVTNVARLRPEWVFKPPKTVTASPAVVDGTVFVGAWDGVMYAVDAADGDVLWTYVTEPAPGATFGPIVSSAAVADVATRSGIRKIVVFGAGPRLYALDAETGEEVWIFDLSHGMDDTPTEFESSPAVHEGVVYVGVDTHNRPPGETGGVRGALIALDASTGRERWRFETEQNMRGSGCGGVWSSPAVDPRRDAVYLGTGNCPADVEWSPFVEAVTALDASARGKPRVLWSFQPHEPNRHDWDFGATPNLFVDAAGRPVVGIGNKDGLYYALAPESGELLWKTKVAEPGDVREDFSIGGFIGSTAVVKGNVFGATALGGPPYYHSLDGAEGQVRWRGAAAPSYAASSVVNDVVLSPALDGVLRAYHADSGAVLWSGPLLGPGSSAPAVVEDMVFVGSGTSSSDACAKDVPIFSDVCMAAFSELLGATGGIHAFRLQT